MYQGHISAYLGKPSLANFLVGAREQNQVPSETLLQLIQDIAIACTKIGDVIQRATFEDMLGDAGTQNPSGDVQTKLDLIAHQLLMDALEANDTVCAAISEEVAGTIGLSNKDAKYVVAFDPLDGSSNLSVHAPVGTIFSIYERISSPGSPIQLADVLQPGRSQCAAGYVLYSTSMLFVCTMGHGTHGFTYTPMRDEFYLTHPDIQFPQDGKVYAVNDGYYDLFPEHVQSYIRHCGRHLRKARYMGALVADFHRSLLQGGIYMYPPSSVNPEGKLRLTLECNALAWMAEQAGGAATNGIQPILSLQPQSIHQRVPLYMGDAGMVAQVGNVPM